MTVVLIATVRTSTIVRRGTGRRGCRRRVTAGGALRESGRIRAAGTKVRVAKALRQCCQDLRSQRGATGAIVSQELQLQGDGRGLDLREVATDYGIFTGVLGSY